MKVILTIAIVWFGICSVNYAMALEVSRNSNNTHVYEHGRLIFQENLKVKSRKQATTMVKQKYDARIVSVVSANVNGDPGYKAKLLSKEGTVFYVFINAKTGQMSRS